jgi:uncharacterized protein YhaN
MKLLSLEVEGLGLFSKRRHFSFAEDGVSIVFGPNESGKSTLMEAVVATIFGFEKKEQEERFRSWAPSAGFRAVVEAKVGPSVFMFSRDFATNEVVVTRLDGRKKNDVFRGDAGVRSKSEERRKYVALLQELFGFSDGELARKTAFVGQLDLETELTPELRGLVTGGGPTDFQRALEVLEDRFEGLTVENPWGSHKRRTKREIENNQDKLEQEEAKLELAEDFVRNSVSLKTETDRLREQKQNFERELGHEKGFLEKLSGLLKLQESLSEAKKLLDSETKAKLRQEKVRETLDKSRKNLPENFPVFAGVNADFSPLLARAVSAEDALAAAHQRLAEALDRETTARPVAGRLAASFWTIGFVPAVCFLVFLLVGYMLSRPLLCGLAGVGVSLGLAFLLFLRSRATGKRLSPAAVGAVKVGETREEITALEKERNHRVEELLALLPENERSMANGRGARQLAADYERYNYEKRHLAELEKGIGGEDKDSGEKGYRDALTSVAVLESRIEEFVLKADELLPLKDEPEKATATASRARARVSDLDEKLKSLESELREKDMAYSKLSATQVLPPEVHEEEIERLEKTRSRLLLRKDALVLAIDTLKECVHDYQAHPLERISERVSGLFGTVTGGRYRAVELSEDLEPELEVGQGPVAGRGIKVSASVLSAGALDQLHFCMRIAMLEELSGEKGLPLILDDPFVNFDTERLERARRLLSDLSGKLGFQVILFTHGERHLKWDAHVVRLDAADVL